jgi:hypothetical protein
MDIILGADISYNLLQAKDKKSETFKCSSLQ